MGMKQNQIRWMIIIICVVILISGPGRYLLGLESIGYTFGGEGVSASFVGIEWNYGTEHEKSDLRSDTKFYFDADDPNVEACNLVGEMTNAFVPKESFAPSWVPSEWVKATAYINNPIETDAWELPHPDVPSELISYEVTEWLLRLYISITAEWDTNDESWNRRYQDTEVWIELDINRNSWIFEGQAQPYFAISKVKAVEFAPGKLGETEEDYQPTPQFSVIPESDSWMYIYYQKWGSAGQVRDFDPFSYTGRQLNPDLFTDKVYFCVNLANFGTYYDASSWLTPIQGPYVAGDAVTWAFDVHVYVVGEWQLQDVSELPEEYGRIQQVQEGWLSLLLQDPRFPLFSFIGLIALVVLALAIFAPWALFAIFGAVGMLRSKK